MQKFRIIFQQLIHRKSKEKKFKTVLYRIYGVEILLVFMLVVLISLMFPRGTSYQFSGLKDGEIYIGDKIIAPFTFAINKTDEEYEADIKKEKQGILTVFVKEDSTCDNQYLQASVFFDSLKNIIDKNNDSPLIKNRLSNFLKQHKINLDENILEFFKYKNFNTKIKIPKEKKDKSLITFRDTLLRLTRDICSIGILNLSKDAINSKEDKISVLIGNEEITEDLNYFHDSEDVKSTIIDKLRSAFSDDELQVNIGYQILVNFLTPNIFYDEQETDFRINEAISNVPRAKGTVLENEKIIDTYEKITKEHIAKLNSLAIEMAEREAGTSLFLTIFRYFGKFLMVCLALSPLIIFLIFNRWRLLRILKKVVLIALILLLVTFLSFVISKFTSSSYLLPVTIASMLLTIFFDTRMGFVGTISLSLILGGIRGNEFIVMSVSIIAGLIAILSVAKVRSRTWFFKSILMITGAYLISITAIEILRYTSFSKLLEYWLYGIINGFLSPLLAQGFQVLFESIFDMITDLRLLELSDLNRPLLRRLAVEAPGTYHHSIMVGNLAESAAEAVGANTLLTRVGAYYHDIGKIEKSEYFVENIKKTKNPHEKLSPSMSCLILINHVRKGIEVAQKHRIPKEVQDFISEHHGTTVMSFFYQKAVEMNKDNEVDISTFRYPGPKPHTKETGIVMLADGVEAASRTLKDPSPSRIKGLVTSIVNERFKDFELDDSPLTLKDLNKIIDSFQNILLGTFHARVEYPKQEEKFFPKNNIKEKAIELKD